VPHIFIIFFCLALNANSISYVISYFTNSNIILSDNIYSDEENEKEEKKSEEETEVDTILDKLIYTKSYYITFLESTSSQFSEKNNFYFSEYYKTIYFPPELV